MSFVDTYNGDQADGYVEDEPTYAGADADDSYGFSSSPIAEYSPSPFNGSLPGLDGEGADGFFSAPDAGPLLPDPCEMREEGTAFREWRRFPMVNRRNVLESIGLVQEPLSE